MGVAQQLGLDFLLTSHLGIERILQVPEVRAWLKSLSETQPPSRILCVLSLWSPNNKPWLKAADCGGPICDPTLKENTENELRVPQE